MTITFQEHGLTALGRELGALASLTKRGVAKEIRLSAGRLAENMAYATQPFGDSIAARKSGEKNVSKDIYKVFSTKSNVYNTLAYAGMKDYADAFWVNKDIPSKAMDVLRVANATAKFKGFENPSKQKHFSQRVKGRVKKSSETYIERKDGSIKRYIAQRQRMVGFAKAGFSACARALGKRVSMQWVTRHNNRAPHNVVDGTNVNNPYVVFTNKIPYASDLINQTSYNTALALERKIIQKQIAVLMQKGIKKAA